MKRARWWLAPVWAAALLVACAYGADQSSRSAAPDESRESGGTVASAPAAGDTKAGAAGQQPAAGAPLPAGERKIIANVFLDLAMKEVQSGFERIGAIAEANGGLVAESSVRQEGEQRRASITVRVPVSRYQDVLGQIRGLATKVESERSNANDVTEEYTDLQSRVRNLEATEAQLLVFLGQAKNIQEVLQVQDRLNSTRAEIERVKGRIALLSRLTELATIQAQLRPEGGPAVNAPRGGPAEALQRGWDASTAVLGLALYVVLQVAAFSWWLVPFALLGGWLLRRRLAGQTYPPDPLP